MDLESNIELSVLESLNINGIRYEVIPCLPELADTAEFCSTCHKVHLDGPVNDYRWLRGFNDYDNWQAVN